MPLLSAQNRRKTPRSSATEACQGTMQALLCFCGFEIPPLSVGVYSPSMVHILLKTTSCRFPRVAAFKIRKHHGGLQTLTGGFVVPTKRLQSPCYEFEKASFCTR